MHNDKILDMVNFADKYPDMNLIVAHLGSMEHMQAIKKQNMEISILILLVDYHR